MRLKAPGTYVLGYSQLRQVCQFACLWAPQSQGARSLNILLVEDNVVNQKVAVTVLSKMGHNVTLAVNGLEAVERWRTGQFDLIFMDVQMPGMNGQQAAKQIRREEVATGLHVPIVAMTASAMNEDREGCLAGGHG